ncbi:MAG TPA: orotidine-5'-phosphate decarboxylase [Bacillaceae bacterium]
MNRTPIIALDFPDKKKTEDFLGFFQGKKLSVKVGMELYYKEGAPLIDWLKEQGHDVFLDLKLHDIPNTVYSAMKILAQAGADMVNVHASGGTEMMREALRGLEEGTPAGKNRPLLIAVTQLTSTDEEQMQNEQLIDRKLKESVLHYARLAHRAGLDGVVCSAHEASAIEEATSPQFLRVTPGIRLSGQMLHDQKRVVNPSRARRIGSSMIVIGRPVTQSEDPVWAYNQVVEEWEMET